MKINITFFCAFIFIVLSLSFSCAVPFDEEVYHFDSISLPPSHEDTLLGNVVTPPETGLIEEPLCKTLAISGRYYRDLTGQSAQLIDNHLYLISSASKRSSAAIIELNSDLEEIWRGDLDTPAKIAGHATSLAYKKGFPALLGINQKFLVINWDFFRQDGNLSRAIMRDIADPLAENFSRGEYVTLYGKTYLATSDYVGNIRLYDAEKLRTAASTIEEGVLFKTIAMPPFVQSLVWQNDKLLLVRNIENVLGMQLTSLNLDTGEIEQNICFTGRGELEGYRQLPDGREIFLTGEYGEAGGLMYVTEVP